MTSFSVGRQGQSVRKLQELLSKFDLLSSEDIDGNFGQITKQAVRRFQVSVGLDVDGIAGDLTLAKLTELEKLPIASQSELISQTQIAYIFGKEIEPYLFADLNNCFNKFDITTPARIRHFVSQIAHESAGFQLFEELATGDDYEPGSQIAIDLGNTEPGDGRRFKGGGAIQLTGRYNYLQFAKFMADDRIMEGSEYVAATYPITSAGFWWHDNNMNQFIDSGAGVREVSKKVNGGWNGLSDRTRYYNLAFDAIAG